MSEFQSPARAAPSRAVVPHAPAFPWPVRAWQFVRRRLAGPGGLYNFGNAIGLLGGIALQIAAAGAVAGLDLRTGTAAAIDYFAGSASAVAITVAMLVFFWSGEVYHRAWAAGFPPDRNLNRLGDLLSGHGALILGLGLLLLGEPLLAATAGLLHAIGKYGSAWHDAMPDGLARLRPDPFRSAVLASRVPAIVLVLMEIGDGLATAQPGAVAAPALLLVCYLIWAAADLMLFRSPD
jgi:hypothetical protein